MPPLICPHGHQWSVPADPSTQGATLSLSCPICGAAPAPPPPAAFAPPSADAAAAERINMPGYEILEELGRGGMGVVYKAHQFKLGRLVAIKMILSGGHASAAELARFRTEAEAIARLQHPNIVQVHEVGEHQGKPFFSLEFCPGGSLDRKLDGTPLPPQEAARLVEQLARAMQAAHAKSVLHRDLKPANVLLGEDGTPKITDFGLAKKMDEAARQTQSGAIMGTPSYMAPEQAGGQSKEIGPAVDVYALGAILYELLTGRPPFKAATTLETIVMVTRDEPVPPSRLQPKTPRDLETICLKCLRKEPARRYVTAAALADDLSRFLRGEPVVARPTPAWERVLKWARRYPAGAALVAVSLLAVAGFLAGGLAYHFQLADALGQAQVQRKEAVARAEEAQRERQAAVKSLYQALLREAQILRLARVDGYRVQAWQRLQQAYLLDTPDQDAAALRQEAAACLGDFVGLAPTDLADFPREGAPAFPAGPLAKMAVHPNGSQAAIALTSGAVELRNIRTGARRALAPHHASPVTSLAFDPAGQVLAAGHKDGTIGVWRRQGEAGWEAVKSLQAPRDVHGVAVTPDGKTLLSGSLTADEVRLWNLADGSAAGPPLPGPKGAQVRCLALSNDGHRVAAGFLRKDEHVILVWDVATRRLEHTLTPGMGKVYEVAFDREGGQLACGCTNGFAVYELSGGRRTLAVQGDTIFSVAFSPDGQTLAAACHQVAKVRLWSLTANREVALLSHPGRHHTTRVAFTPDGRTLLSQIPDSVRLWDLAGASEKRILASAGGGVPDIAFRPPDGAALAAVRKGQPVRVWDPHTGKLLPGPPVTATHLAFSADGRLLVTASAALSLQVWDAQSWARLAVTEADVGYEVWTVSFSPDGRWLAAAGRTGVRLWRVRTEGIDRLRVTLTPEERRLSGEFVTWLCFSPDSRLLAWEANGPLHLWDLGAHKPLPAPSTHCDAGIFSHSFFPDSRRLVLVSEERVAEVWDVRSNNKLFSVADKEWQKATGIPTGWWRTVPSPDGRLLAVGGDRVSIWDVQTRQLVVALRKESAALWGIAWSPDGRRLALGYSDGELAIWSLPEVRSRLAEIGLGW